MFISLDDIPNKKDFEQDLVAKMEGGRTVSLIFVDLDGFKTVNDQHGHPEGDRCLMESAAAMSKVIVMAWIMEVIGGEGVVSFSVNIQIEEYRPATYSPPRKGPKRRTS